MTKPSKLSEDLFEIFACPACQGAIEVVGSSAQCEKCKKPYPILAGIPLLIKQPERWLIQWRDAWDVFVARSEKEEKMLREQLKSNDLLMATRDRLSKIILGVASHRKKLHDILKPLLKDQESKPQSTAMEANRRINANDQSILAYSSNLLRDWGWKTDENAKSLAVIEKLLGGKKDLGSVLVLGAGAARLAYDIHRAYVPKRTVALDFNPVLFLSAGRLIYDGDHFELTEFVQTPIDGKDPVVQVPCNAPGRLSFGDFSLCFGDVLEAPFQPVSFDTVVTPWMIDVVPGDLKIFASKINALLKKGGRWLNLGPLGYNPREARFKYGIREIQELLPKLGFEVELCERFEVPYLKSPHSCQSRYENILGISAKKTSQAKEVTFETQKSAPPWIEDPLLTVPALPEFQVAMQAGKLLADILSLVDGKRSLSDMSTLLAHHYKMDPATATELVRKYLSSLIT